jgi:hypothetical protein
MALKIASAPCYCQKSMSQERSASLKRLWFSEIVLATDMPIMDMLRAIGWRGAAEMETALSLLRGCANIPVGVYAAAARWIATPDVERDTSRVSGLLGRMKVAEDSGLDRPSY